MSKAVITLVAATFVCGSASAYLWQELRTERAESRSLQARVVELERAQAKATHELKSKPESRQEAIEAPVTDVQAAVPKPAPATMAGVPAQAMLGFSGAGPGLVRERRMNPDMQRRMQESFEQQRRMLQDPEYRDLMRAQQKTGMKRMYGDMELMLGVSKEEADHILDVLAEQQLRSMEQQRAFMPTPDGSPPDEAAIREQQRIFADIKRKNDEEMNAVLGAKAEQWREYQQSMWSRSQVTQLREALASSDEPLRQDQIKPLVQAIAREQQQMQTQTMASNGRARFSSGGPSAEEQARMQEEWLERTAESHQRIRNAVSSLLSPAQLQQLQDQQDQERKMQELSLRMSRARAAEIAARGEDPANGGFAAYPGAVTIVQ